METTNTTSQGTNSVNQDIIYMNHVFIEEISTRDGKTGYVFISYCKDPSNKNKKKEYIQLIVSRNTIIMNEFAEPLSLCNLKKGMYIDVVISPAMTKSIPPQARALQIIATVKTTDTQTTTDRVISVDLKNGFLCTGNPYEASEQMRFVITKATTILDRNGNRIPLSKVKPGQLVKVEHASFQTASIPPQTTAFCVQVLSYSSSKNNC